MGWTARIDTAPVSHFLAIAGTAIGWLIVMIIVAFAGMAHFGTTLKSTRSCNVGDRESQQLAV